MKNPGISILSDNGMVRGYFLNSKELVQQAFDFHKTSPVVTAGLGRLLTASAMMGRMLKNDSDLLTLQIECGGPVKTLLATANRKSQVKGYPGVPIVDIPLNKKGKLDVSGSLGPGFLTVLRDNGEGEPYVSRTMLVSGEIAEDITYYYATSEQTPTVCALGVLIDRDYSLKSAGGFILQLLPGADEETIAILEENVEKVQNVSAMFEHTSNEEIANILMDRIPYHINENWNAEYHCNCSKEKTEKVLLTLGKKDLAELIEAGEPVELCCHFCDKAYVFSTDDLKKLLLSGIEK
jgi:molecular chaperone Hsp33